MADVGHLTNLKAERAVIGNVLFLNTLHEHAAAIIRADMFSVEAHRKLWRRITSMIEMGETADGITLEAFAKETPEIRDLGGPAYVYDLMEDGMGGPSDVRDYSKTIADLAARRLVWSALQEMQQEVATASKGTSASSILEAVRERLIDAESLVGYENTTLESASDVVDSVLKEMEDAMATGKRLPEGISTGSGKLDALIGKMHPGDLIVLAGRPAMGKTAVGMNIAMFAKKADERGNLSPCKVAVLSLEMDRKQLAYRVSSSAARRAGMGHIAYRRAREGKLGQSELATLRAAWKKIPTSIAWETRGRLSLDEVKVTIKAARKKLGGLDLVVIDYLQIMRLDFARGQNKTDVIGDITSSLKALAKELGVAIVLLSQLSRNVETRDDKRPIMADLRDSGSIEQDADMVLMVYREEYYLEQAKPPKGAAQKKKDDWDAAIADCADKVEIIAAKVRNGNTGYATLHFERATDTIVDEKSDLYEEKLV